MLPGKRRIRDSTDSDKLHSSPFIRNRISRSFNASLPVGKSGR